MEVYVLALVLATAAAAPRGGQEAFCDKYLAAGGNDTAPGLHWAKTLNSFDVGVVQQAKFLYCCAVGASSILWYKDGHLLDATWDEFKPYPERGNDTIFAPYIVMDHAGRYRCVASDGQRQIVHDIRLNVTVEKNYHGKPIVTATPKDQYAEIGESAEMFCEAFVGFGEDTIAISGIVWLKTGDEMNFADRLGGRIIVDTERDGRQIMGAYLRFENITAEDFGAYTCKIENGLPAYVHLLNATLREGEDPNMRVKYRPTYQHTLVVLAVFVACFAATAAITVRYRLEILLFWKDHFGKLEDDGKEYDVFVCYDAEDADFALGILVATLEQKFHYRCYAHERDSIAGDPIMETYCRRIRASRRFVMVLSPSLVCNAWCTYALYVAVNAMLNLQSRIICVVLQNVSWPVSGAKENDPILQHVLPVVKKIRWEVKHRRPFPLIRGDSHDDMLPNSPSSIAGSPRFWMALRILLPPKRGSIPV